MEKGSLVISLDFELIWGIFDHIEIANKATYFDNTLNAIPRILDLFVKQDIHITWATVGMLFNRNWDEWETNIPFLKPLYQNKRLDPYTYGRAHQKVGYDRFFFAPHLIREIKQAPNQEIGTHTYSHYYCLETGQEKEQFEADLDKAISIAENYNIQLKSLVYPRNQFNQEYLESCAKRGITSVRSNPSVWYWDTTQTATLKTKIFRTGDAYLPFRSKCYPSALLKEDIPQCQPASRFLRPQHKYKILNSLRLFRIQQEMIAAAKKGEIYHLWWHPHNFGNYPEESLMTLKTILETFLFCKEKYDFESLNMAEVRNKK